MALIARSRTLNDELAKKNSGKLTKPVVSLIAVNFHFLTEGKGALLDYWMQNWLGQRSSNRASFIAELTVTYFSPATAACAAVF